MKKKTGSSIVAKNKWKPVKLEGSILTEMDGLVGIEELTDYSFESDKKKKKKVTKSIAKKRTVENEEDETPPKKKQKKKKKPKKNQQVELEESNEETPEDVPTTTITETDDSIVENEIDIDTWRSLGVPEVLLKALADQKFVSPTAIQSLTIPAAILGKRDILGAAETGSGKTLAFGIPMISGIMRLKENSQSDEETRSNEEEKSDSEQSDEEVELNEEGIGCVRVIDNIKMESQQRKSEKPLYALILTPTRELAVQIKDHLTKITKYTDLKIAVVIGGMAAVKQERILSKCPEIVIATPGRLWELIDEGNPHLSRLDEIKFLAIDETDRMLERGHFLELEQILEKINSIEENVKKRQTFVFSATLTMVHEIPKYLQRKKQKSIKSKIFKLTPGLKLQRVVEMLGMKNPKIVDVTKKSGTADNLTECKIACTMDHKDYYLYYFLQRYPGRTLVFCNSIGCVKRLATLFGIVKCSPLPLHASMRQQQRLKNLERFQADPQGLLIATDVAARGLDIPNVEHVIHYQVPRTSESYVHRSGRTARAQKEGITILMMEPSEKENYVKLCKTLDRTQDIPNFPVVDRLLIAVKERVNVAREIDKLELKSKRNDIQKGWLEKAVTDMDLVLDEDQLETTMESKEVADLKRKLKAQRQKLESLIRKPLFPKGFSGKYPDTNINIEILSGQVEQDAKKAVDLMKNVISESATRKGNNNKKKKLKIHKKKKRVD